MGGLTRIATLFREMPAEHVLRVDAGDAIEGPADFQRIEHLAILKAFAAMDYAAANIGHREAQLTLTQLQEVRGKAAVPLISANLLDATTRQPVFETHRILKTPARIAIVGVVDPRGLSDSLGEGLVVEKMETALGNLLPKLKTEADFIVLLAFTDEATLHTLAREFYEVDVILGGNVSQPAQKLERENRSVILYTANQSRAVGTMSLQLTAPHRVKVRVGEVVLVSDQIPEDTAIHRLASDYRAEIRSTKLDLDDPAKLGADMIPGVKAGADFAGSEACLGCHAAAADVWKESHHSRAFATLIRQEADADPNCIGCHTVGFGSPGGYRREFGAEKLTNVGCESCHGAGANHVAERARGLADGAKFRPLGAGDCQKCHHGEFSRPFDFDKFWPLIRHGK
ncbi:MAG: multiheme c-type cytochrome [Chthoniobacteraceae bacterium]